MQGYTILAFFADLAVSAVVMYLVFVLQSCIMPSIPKVYIMDLSIAYHSRVVQKMCFCKNLVTPLWRGSLWSFVVYLRLFAVYS